MYRRRFLSVSAKVAASIAVVPQLGEKSAEAKAAPPDAPPLPSKTMRITFGIGDSAPQAWDGELVGSAGHFQVAADHFRADDFTELVYGTSAFQSEKTLQEVPFPNDFIRTPSSWVCSTRRPPEHGPTTEWHIRTEQPKPVIESPSILVRQEIETPQPLQVKTAQGEFNLEPGKIQPFQPASFLNGSVQIEYVPPTAPATTGRLGHQDFPSILATETCTWAAWLEYDGKSDSVLVQKRVQGKSETLTVIADNCDAFRVALGEDKLKRIWAIWAMKAGGKWNLYGRVLQDQSWSPLQQLTHGRDSDVYHTVVKDSNGQLWVVWQRSSPSSQIFARYFDGKIWSEERQISEGVAAGSNNWWPAVAAGPEGSLVVAWDGYAYGTYDIYLRRFKNDRWSPVETVTSGARFHAHPSVAFGKNGVIWIAWDESGDDWGKDVGFLVPRQATSLHQSRSVQFICLDGNKGLTTIQPLSDALAPGTFWELPHLQVDGEGCPWLFVRHLTLRQPDTPLEGPIDLGLWEIFATKYDGSKWLAPLRLAHSTGRNEMLPSSTLDPEGNLWLAWATDKRSTKSFHPHQLQVQIAQFPPLPLGEPVKLKPEETPANASEQLHPQEVEHLKRIRAYQIECGGRKFHIFRGDLHRHTDISADGPNDGSLLDAYRYARDAAALDFLGITDHDDNAIDPYNWWHSQRMADLFQVRDSFAAFYSYERSIAFPNGHRNVFFTERGRQITPILSSEFDGWEGAETLYAYLRSVKGIAISHTTGRTSGTDWRDHDPAVENVVEIYQGMRDTYEYPGAPRPFRISDEWLNSSKPIPRASSSEGSASFRRQGFVSYALARGYKLGFIASSDHISCHAGYACVLAENLSLASLAEAIRARRTYAATDNIILDVTYLGSDGWHAMGEEFASTRPIQIHGKIYGTDTISQVDIMSNGKSISTLRPDQPQFEFRFTHPNPASGVSYFYVRVIQKDGGMAWGSPAWVTYSG